MTTPWPQALLSTSPKVIGPFDSINGSCWNTAAEYLTQSAADFVAIQETKVADDSIKGYGTGGEKQRMEDRYQSLHYYCSGRQIRRDSSLQQDADWVRELL